MGSIEGGFYIHPVLAIIILISLGVIVGGAVLFARWGTREN
jgi:hypothetical protein